MAVIVPFENPQDASIDPLVKLVAADMERVNAAILSRRLVERGPEYDASTVFIPHFIDAVVDVLVISRNGGTRSSIRDSLTSDPSFLGQLMNLVDHALCLNKALGEDITSGDLEPANERPEATWDPLAMDEAYGCAVL